MSSYRKTAVVLVLGAAVFFNLSAQAQDLDRSRSKQSAANVTRIFVLQTIDTQEAATLLRSEAKVRRIVQIRDLRTLVVTDTAEAVTRSESLLREKEALDSSSVPHEPIDVASTLKAPVKTRVFKIEGLDTHAVVPVLQSMYGIREVKAEDDGVSVSVRAKLTKLEAAEALLRELEILGEVTEPAEE